MTDQRGHTRGLLALSLATTWSVNCYPCLPTQEAEVQRRVFPYNMASSPHEDLSLTAEGHPSFRKKR